MASISPLSSSTPSPSSDSNSLSNSLKSVRAKSSLDNDALWPSDYAPLFKDKHRKTIDIGANGSTLSASPLGTILQMSIYHHVHGIVVASPHAQFDGEQFNNPEYVRSYRKLMLEDAQQGRHGFGIQMIGESRNLEVGFRGNFDIQIAFDVGDASIQQLLTVNDEGQAVQTLHISSGSHPVLRYVFGLGVSVNRASYGQLTEGGPIPIPKLKNVLELQDKGRRGVVVNPNLDARLEANLVIDGCPMDLKPQIQPSTSHGAPVSAEYAGEVHARPQNSVKMTATFQLFPRVASSCVKNPSLPPTARLRGDWRIGDDEEIMVIKRNLEYILGNCMMPVEDDAICLLADHVALPLGWNRDNYYQVRFLLDVYGNLDHLTNSETARHYAKLIKKVTRGHLVWVYRKVRRPSGYWHRSYLANGLPKDGPVFQFDQQCYPLLEICDFLDAFPEERDFVKELMEESTVSEILDTLVAHRDRTTGLYVTDETPGDDAVVYPFHFSSHVLLWHTLTRMVHVLRDVGGTTKLQIPVLENMASTIKKATFSHFVCEEKFAYLSDGNGNHMFYHDANDLPTLFALDWGFVTKQSERVIWENTMSYGLSPANKEAFFPSGRFQGLGSVHTRAPWPLGYAQELIYAELTGNMKGRKSAWNRIKGAMFWDGLFSEAVDCETGKCVSKAWFSWPGAVIGSALLRTDRKIACLATTGKGMSMGISYKSRGFRPEFGMRGKKY